MYLSKRRFLIGFILVLAVQLACNMPGEGTPTPSGADLIYTAAAQTVEAQLTQVNQPPATPVGGPTVAPSATRTPSDTASPTSAPEVTNTPQPTATPVPCNLVKFVSDVTYPDNSEVPPGENFVKTWRIQNTGSCTWTSDYALAFAGGEAMGAPSAVALTGNVAPRERVDVSVTLTAPDTDGTYRGDWKMRNDSGALFGIGDGSKPFWVQIKVSGKTGLMYDFLVNAKDAKWEVGVGSDPGDSLTFGGDDNDPNGVAKIKDNVKLENGATSGKLLLTHPKHENDGYVSGIFPAYLVQSGDQFKARLGFMIPEGETGCGAGKVKFRLAYKEDDDLKQLKEWTKSCDGSLKPVEVDLSDLRGKSVQFVLKVKADGASTDDWAIWNSPRVER